MTYKVIVRPQAEQDLEQAQRWYDDQRVGLGSEFRGVIGESLARLAEAPMIYPVVHRRVHRAVLRRFPYLVYFTVSRSTVLVVACLHSSRNPLLIRSRGSSAVPG